MWYTIRVPFKFSMSKKFFLSFAVAIFLIVFFGVSVWWYFFRGGKTPEQAVIEIPEWYYTDKDGDTISDEKERELGTNPNEGDTDGDSIPDQLEIDQYKTDPRNVDTDGDGYRDGVEIIKGFDPLTTN